MNILALYDNGETLSWDERVAIAAMRKVGFPADYLDFIEKYGCGAFAGHLTLTSPTKVLPRIAQGFGDRLEIAGMDYGTLYVADHAGKILFDYEPRVPKIDGDAKVFDSFDKVLFWILKRSKPQFPFPSYDQFDLPSYALQAKNIGLKRKEINELEKRIQEVLVCRDLAVGSLSSSIIAIAPTLGVYIELSEGDTVHIRYALGSKIAPLLELLAEFGFVHHPDPWQDEMRTLVCGD